MGVHCLESSAKVTLEGSIPSLPATLVDRSTKILPIGRMHHMAHAKFWAEVEKCQLLCVPCHRQKSIECGDVRVAAHGSWSMYRYHGCRCVECRNFNNKNRRERRARKMRDVANPAVR